MNLVEKFKNHLVRNNLIQEGDCILLAVSGGLDSVALLHLFCEIQDMFHLKLAIVHVHHGIRDKEADRDLEFVRALSDHYKLPFYFQKVDAPEFAQKEKYSLEESARILRYQFYEKTIKKSKFTKLATGHTANDQTETILQNLLRGSGILGMSGISETRGPYIRPLLIFARHELEVYVKQQELQYCQDSTNRELKYRRNRIRSELIPYLKENFNSNLIKTLNRSGEIFTENEQFLKFHADESFDSLVINRKKNKIILDINHFLNYFIILRKYIIFRAFDELSIKRNLLNFDKLNKILNLISNKKIGKQISFDRDWCLYIDHDGIVIKKNIEPFPRIEFNVLEKGPIRLRDYEFRWTIIERQYLKNYGENPNIEFLDFEQTGSLLYFRNFQPGDRFVPLNFTGHKKVADFFSDRKIPHHLREEIPILDSKRGIVWICGYCIDDRFKISSDSKRILKVEMKEISNAT